MLKNHCLLINSKNFIAKLFQIISSIKNVLEILFSVKNEDELLIQESQLKYEAEMGGLNIVYLTNKMNSSCKIHDFLFVVFL